MALPINIDELLRGNGHFLATVPIHQAFVDEKAYLVSIGKELDKDGKKEGKKDNDFLKDFPKDFPKDFGKRTCNTENDKKDIADLQSKGILSREGGRKDGRWVITNKNSMSMNKREYTQANKDWLTNKAQEEGVKPLPKGIYYKVLAEGKADGKHPMPRSIVTAHYTGRTIDGKQFDSSRGGAPLAIRLCDLIEGWIIAMQQMCVGDKWEVYIPAEMGYGKFSQPGIPGGSTLIFEIELLGIA